MTYDLTDLDVVTRAFMIQELDYDVSADAVFGFDRLTDPGRLSYVPLLEYALAHGDIDGLAHQLGQHGRTTDARRLAESAWLHYYIRAICRRALSRGDLWVEVCRVASLAEVSAKINTLIDPVLLLQDLRSETRRSVAGGSHSGIAVRLTETEDAPGADAIPPEFAMFVSAPRVLRTPWAASSYFRDPEEG